MSALEVTTTTTDVPVPLVDLAHWFHGDADDRREVAVQVDHALRTSGFLLVTGHEVPDASRDAARDAARDFFALPAEVKARYTVAVGGRGWLPPGAEANGRAEAPQDPTSAATPPDLKESWSVGADEPSGDAEIDAQWFPPNVWPAEVPALRAALDQ